VNPRGPALDQAHPPGRHLSHRRGGGVGGEGRLLCPCPPLLIPLCVGHTCIQLLRKRHLHSSPSPRSSQRADAVARRSTEPADVTRFVTLSIRHVRWVRSRWGTTTRPLCRQRAPSGYHRHGCTPPLQAVGWKTVLPFLPPSGQPCPVPVSTWSGSPRH